MAVVEPAPEEVPTLRPPAPALRDIFAPRDMEQLMKLAGVIAKSNLVPSAYRGKPDDIIVAASYGAEVGLTLWQSLQWTCVINGRPQLFGDGDLAVVRASGRLEYIQEWLVGDGDAMEASCEVKRRGEPQSVRRSFSVAQAKKAGLWGKDGPWRQYPERMLLFRARKYALRDTFGDVLGGLASNDEWVGPETQGADYMPGMSLPEVSAASQAAPAAEPPPTEAAALPVTCAACDELVDETLLPWLRKRGWPMLCRQCGSKAKNGKASELPEAVRQAIEAAEESAAAAKATPAPAALAATSCSECPPGMTGGTLFQGQGDVPDDYEPGSEG